MELKYKTADEQTEVTGDFDNKHITIDLDTLMTTTTGLYFKTVNIDVQTLEDHIAVTLGYGGGILATLTLNANGLELANE